MPVIMGKAAYPENILSKIREKNIKLVELDAPARIVNGRTMVPMRKIFEEMGTVVEWDNANQTAIATNDLCVINATINNSVMKINGTPIIKTTVPPKTVETNLKAFELGYMA